MLEDPGECRRTVHGSLVLVFGTGLLLLGESGAGKTAACVELIGRGHKLVADDSVELTRAGDHILGRAPDITSGLIARRGLGISDVRRTFGHTSFFAETRVDICIELCGAEREAGFDRAPVRLPGRDFFGIQLPSYRFAGRTPPPILLEAISRISGTKGPG